MAECGHLWAIGFENLLAAERFRAAVTCCAVPEPHLVLRDLVILTRAADGSYALDRRPFPGAGNVLAHCRMGFVAGLALGMPLLTGDTVAHLLGTAGTNLPEAVGIDAQFIAEVEKLLRPGTCAVLMLDDVGNLEKTLEGLRGMGGTVLKTNVDISRLTELQTALRHQPGPPTHVTESKY